MVIKVARFGFEGIWIKKAWINDSDYTWTETQAEGDRQTYRDTDREGGVISTRMIHGTPSAANGDLTIIYRLS